MSLEQLKAFLEKVKADTSLQEQLKAEPSSLVLIADQDQASQSPQKT